MEAEATETKVEPSDSVETKDEPTEPKAEPTPEPKVDNHKQVLNELYTTRSGLKKAKTQVETLTTQLAEAQAAQAAGDEAIAKFQRLEALLGASTGPIAQLLDSRKATEQLFNSDTPVEDILKAFVEAQPSVGTKAIGSGPAKAEPQKDSLSSLIHQAIQAKR